MLPEPMEESLRFFVVVMAELAVLFLGVSVVVGLARQYLSEGRVRGALELRWGLGKVLGAAFGSLTPFCSFSTIPILIGLLRSGAPFGAATAFLFASPLANPVVLGLFLLLFGWRIAVVYAALSLSLAVLVGVAWERLELHKHVREGILVEGCGMLGVGGDKAGLGLRLWSAAMEGWVEFRRALPYLFAGVAAGAVIQGFVPEAWISSVAGPENPFAIPVAAAIGAPLYIWPETVLPMGVAFVDKGMGVGTLIALVVGGAGTSIPEVAVLGTVFKPRLLLVFVATVLALAIFIGYTFAFLF